MRILVFIIVFFSFFDLFTQLPIMTPLATSLGATPFITGLAVGMYSFSNTIGNVASGFLTDKKGPFRILLTGLIATAIMLFSYHLAVNPYLLLIIRFLHGLVAGLIVPAAFTYLANSVAKEKKGKGSALSGAFVGLAAVVGPAFSGIVSSKTNEVTVLSITAVFMVILSILAIIFLRKQVITKKEKSHEPPISVRMFFQNPGTIMAFFGALFLMFSQGVLAHMLPLKVEGLGSDTQTTGLLLSTFGIVAILIFVLPSNNIFDRVKSLYTAIFGLSFMGLGMLFISAGSAISQLYVAMAIYGIGFAFLFPSLNTMLIDSTEETYRGKAYGYFYAFFSIGVVLGSGITGLLQLSASGGFLFTGVLLLLCSLLMFLQEKFRQTTMSS